MARFVRPAHVSRLVAREVQSAEERAAAMIRDAEASARARVDEADAEADQIRRAAHELGLAEARAEQAALRIAALARYEAALEDARGEVTELAAAIGARLVGAELAIAPDRIALIAEEALSRATRAKRATLRVHPSDVEALERALFALRERTSAVLAVREDEALTRGGCIVESDVATLDARLEVRLEALTSALARLKAR